MRNSYKVLTAVAVAGLALAGGSAFTGAGLGRTSGAPDSQFVGGTVSQTVTGATLTGVEYGFVGALTGPQTSVNKVTLTFADATGGKTPVIKLNGNAVSDDCGPITGPTTFTSVCDLSTPVADVNQIDVTVPSDAPA
jgi:hypothetical protein